MRPAANANISNSPSAKMLQIAGCQQKYYLSNLLLMTLPGRTWRAIFTFTIRLLQQDLELPQIDLVRLLKEASIQNAISGRRKDLLAVAQAAIILQSNQNDMFGGRVIPILTAVWASDRTFKAAGEDEITRLWGLIYNLNSMHSGRASDAILSINLGRHHPGGWSVTKAVLGRTAAWGVGRAPSFPTLSSGSRRRSTSAPQIPTTISTGWP